MQGCLLDLGLVKTAKRAWMDEKKIGVLFQMENEPDPMFPGVPTYASLCKTEQDRQALAVYAISAGVGRSIMAPPGVPAPRVAALRAAFDATMKDPALLADAAKANATTTARAASSSGIREGNSKYASAKRSASLPKPSESWSSVTRSTSAQAGTTSVPGPPSTTNRPRLKPIASSRRSLGISSAAR